MKAKIMLLAITMFAPFCTILGQTVPNAPTNTDKMASHEALVDSLLAKIDSLLTINNLLLEQIDIDLSSKNRYKLYQTENIYTFLRLDTKTGIIDQVQWSLDDEKEFIIPINSFDFSQYYGGGSGSFELYPTKNMYQFLLIYKPLGHVWHVQWGMKSGERWIKGIY